MIRSWNSSPSSWYYCRSVNADSMRLTLCSDVSFYALGIQSFITDCTSPSAGAGIKVSVFNRSNHGNVRTWEVPLVACIMRRHYSIMYTQSLPAITGLLYKRATEKLNIEEVRYKIKVSNHSATRLVRNFSVTYPIRVTVYYPLLWRPLGVAKPEPEKPAGRVITLLWHARLSLRNQPYLSKLPGPPFQLAT